MLLAANVLVASVLLVNKILAFDQASRTSGWSLFVDGELKEHGKFTFEDPDIGTRLVKIRNKVNELIYNYNPSSIIIEDIQYQTNIGNNVETFKVLAEVFGVIYELATELNIPNSAVLSVTWKAALGIKGRNRPEQKKNAQAWVKNTFNLKVTQDEADAICIGAYASGMKSTKPKTTIPIKESSAWS